MEAARLANRQSIRKRGWNYAAAGWYFVTINTHEGRALFGAVVNGRMVLSEAGRVAEEEWRQSAVVRKGIALDEFVVMPNHVHGIVRLEGLDASSPNMAEFGKPVAGALGTFVGAYKAAVSRVLGRRGLVHQGAGLARQAPTWHRNYWDVIVRDARALAAIRVYIRTNPANYERVMRVGEPRMVGNAELLTRPKLGFLASRGSEAAHGSLPLKPGEAIISGFLSPMERAVFKAGLEHKRPLIWVVPCAPPREGTGLMHQALTDGRLLMVSPFSDDIDAPSLRRAAWCNQYVLAHCDRLAVGRLTPGGMLACVLSEARPELEVSFLCAPPTRSSNHSGTPATACATACRTGIAASS
jgi:putative transposase